MTDISLSSIHNNRAFLNDELQPPPYSSIYPSEDDSSKVYSIANTLSTQNELNGQFIQQINSNFTRPNTNNYTGTSNLFQNSIEPISYDDLFECNQSTINSTRILVQAQNNQHPILTQHWQHQRRTNILIKQLKINFPRSYLLRHTLIITLTSLILITFQTILLSRNSILSNWCSGFWCGFGNLLTLAVSFATSNIDHSNFIKDHIFTLKLFLF